MKKFLFSFLTMVLVLGAGTAFAHGGGDGGENFNFGQMLPFMQDMHPDLSKQELKEMYNSCHGTNGASPSKNFKDMNEMQQENMMDI